MSDLYAFEGKYRSPRGWTDVLAVFIIVLFAAGAIYVNRPVAATLSSCSTSHTAGHYKAHCVIANPTGFHIAGLAKQSYQAYWRLSCTRRTASSWEKSHAEFNGVVAGRIYLTLGRQKPKGVYAAMLRADSCTLDVKFDRLRPAVSHTLAGTITFNYLPRAKIFDHTRAGQ